MNRHRLRRTTLGVTIALAVALAMAHPARALDAGPDTTRWSAEIGAASDFTNEQFYEDAFVDTIALGRRLVSTPESRTSGVGALAWNGTRGERSSSYALRSEVAWGDKLRRGTLHLNWRSPLVSDWRLLAMPRFEYRRDRTFDRDLTEWRGSAGLRIKNDPLAPRTFEFGLDGDFLRAEGDGDAFLLDRDAGRASLGFGSAPLAGAEWRVGYSLAGRAFPDSSVRDHFEHGFDARWRREFGGLALGMEANTQRRVTMKSAPTSRDNFWDGQVSLDLDARTADSWMWRARWEGEAIRYDREDSTLYYDYRIVRARVGPRFESGGWSLGAGPRGEILRSPASRQEEYDEIGGYADIEFIGASFWTIAPAAGWREYRATGTSDPFNVSALHSSFAFYEVALLWDQPLGGGVRLRGFANGRYERHSVDADDARSLYFSLDVRRLF